MTAIEILRKRVKRFPSTDQMADDAITRNVIAAMEEYASQSKWVSCAERLPDEHRRYLCMAYIVDCYVEEVCLYDKENKRFLFNRVEVKVSHYQSLPDKPVEK